MFFIICCLDTDDEEMPVMKIRYLNKVLQGTGTQSSQYFEQIEKSVVVHHTNVLHKGREYCLCDVCSKQVLKSEIEVGMQNIPTREATAVRFVETCISAPVVSIIMYVEKLEAIKKQSGLGSMSNSKCGS